MDPICFHIGSRPIYWYGVLVAGGFLAAVAHWSHFAKREHKPDGFASELGFWIMLSGILGARAAYVAANAPFFLAHPLDILRIDQGGLIFYGGFLGAVLAVYVLARVHRIPPWSMADFAVTPVALGHAIGRMGCFINGCCYGSPTTLPWAVHADGALRHPTQLYEALFNLALYGVLVQVYRRKKTDGVVFAAYLLLYPAGRFLLEFVRGDARLHALGLTVAQLLCLGLIAAGAVLLWILRSRARRSHA